MGENRPFGIACRDMNVLKMCSTRWVLLLAVFLGAVCTPGTVTAYNGDLEVDAELDRTRADHSEVMRSVAFNPDWQLLVSRSREGQEGQVLADTTKQESAIPSSIQILSCLRHQ